LYYYWVFIYRIIIIDLRSWLLLLASEQSVETNTGDLDDLETNARNISLGFTLTTETGNQNFVLFM
jgi:hypothetical protein